MESSWTKSIFRMDQFPYLESTILSSGRAEVDVGRRLAQASKAFGGLHKAVFENRDLTLKTKHAIHQACVLSVLLYGSECWTPLRRDLRRLNAFHHRCVRTVLGISRSQQWTQHITSRKLRQQWGDPQTVAEKVAGYMEATSSKQDGVQPVRREPPQMTKEGQECTTNLSSSMPTMQEMF